mgnify:CR=1 FL=1
MSDAQLEILATHAGLAVDWIDANGRAQKVAPAILRNVLTSLGHPASTAQEIDASLLELQQVQQTRRLPPLLTVDFGNGLDLSHYFAPETPCEVHLEDGARLNLKLNAEALLPGLIPVGYQHVEIAHGIVVWAHAQETSGKLDRAQAQGKRPWCVQVARQPLAAQLHQARQHQAAQHGGAQTVRQRGMDHGGSHQPAAVARQPDRQPQAHRMQVAPDTQLAHERPVGAAENQRLG